MTCPFPVKRLLPPFVVIAAMAMLGVRGTAQVDEPGWYRMGNWQQSNGLPQNWVMSILQTSDGYIWIGMRGGGIARFDGVNFTTYDESKANQLKESEVWALVEGSDSSLWIATYSAGVARMKNGDFTTYTTADGLIDDFVTALSCDRSGGIWMATDQGISCFKNETFTNYSPKDGSAPGGARAIHADADGGVWLGTGRGELYQLEQGKFSRVTPDGPLPATEVRGIYRDRRKALWLTSGDGLFYIQDGKSRRYTTADGLSSNGTYRVLEDSEGNLWVTTAVGLDRFRPEEGIFRLEHQLASGQPINGICEDSEGSLWLGTRNDGVVRLHQGVFVSYTQQHGLLDDTVSSVIEDKTGRIWLGTYKGLHQFQNGKFTALDEAQGLPTRLIVSLGKDRAGHLWVGTSAGLYRSSLSVDKPSSDQLPGFVAIDEAITPRLHVRNLVEDRNGTMWIATNLEGVASYRDGRLTFLTTEQGLAHNAVRGIVEDRDGALWFGTRSGLNRFKDGKFTVYTEKEGLPSNTVQALYLDHAHNLWIGTRRGVSRLSGDRLTTYTAQDGLVSNYVFGFLEDDRDQLWMTCGKGVFYVTKNDLDDFAERRIPAIKSVAYGADHGLRSTGGPAGHSPVSWRARDGRLWFAFMGAVSVVDPVRLVPNRQPPPVHVEIVRVDQQAFDPNALAAVPPGRRDLEFHYTALSYRAPEKMRFKYKLDGYDADWIEAGNRRAAYYSNIPPGDYAFRVIAANHDGTWNTKGDTARLRLRPHFYETSWFVVVCGLGVMLVGFGLHRHRTRSLMAREKKLVEMVDARTQELQKEIGEHTRAEQELRLYRDHLEEQVSARTKALRENRELLESIIDSSAALIYLRDLDGRFMLVNRRFAELCATTKEAMVGKACHDFFSPEQAEAFRAADLQALKAAEPIELEESVTLGGVSHAYLSIKCRLRDEHGHPYAVCGISTEITQMKHMEEQLRQSQKMEAIGRLAGGIAHDFNNLLTGINGYAALALTDLEPRNPVYESLREILKAGERAGSLTRQLLAYSRKQVLVPKRWNLNLIVAEMQTLLRRILGEDVALTATLQPNLGDVLVDRGQVEQILLNLVVNARDAMPNGGKLLLETATVTLDQGYASLHPESAIGPHVMLAVSDTGTGMTAAVKARLFEPFFTTKEQGKGTGLGLSVVYGIVKQSGGSICVYSEVGEGTTFRIYFPQVRNGDESDDPAVPESSEAPRGEETILLVEDEDFVRNFTRSALEARGYKVLTAPDGRQALEVLRQHAAAIDLVLTDAIMPQVGGRELGERIREFMPELPILYMSGYTETSFMTGGLSDAGECFLQKPFSPSELAKKVRGLLRRQGAHGERVE